MDADKQLKKRALKAILFLSAALFLVLLLALAGLAVGSSGLTVRQSLPALFGVGDPFAVRIVRGIRLPRVIAAIVAGAGLSLSGHAMQTALGNPMASPSTLGVSNAAVFGANLAFIAFSGGFFSAGGNVANLMTGVDPFAVSGFAFFFAAIGALLVLGLGKLRSFSPSSVVLAGIAMGSVWQAGATLLQFYATDVGLSAAVIWSFGDLGRANFKTDLIMALTVLAAALVFFLLSRRCNALLAGDSAASSVGVRVGLLRFILLLVSSLVTAVCVSHLGMIGFVGIICPHVVKLTLGQDHRFGLPASALCGSLLLLISDLVSRSVGGGSALPVGAVTSLIGAPFFLALILFERRKRGDA